jgi:hypothetical protein
MEHHFSVHSVVCKQFIRFSSHFVFISRQDPYECNVVDKN